MAYIASASPHGVRGRRMATPITLSVEEFVYPTPSVVEMHVACVYRSGILTIEIFCRGKWRFL